MPYIEKKIREQLEPELSLLLAKAAGHQVGVFNYIITKLVRFCINKTNYANLNAMIGVLECAKLELYRRVFSEYEDRKIEENGDVY